MSDSKQNTKKVASGGDQVDAIISLRPCIVKGRKGYFHCWGTFADDDGSSINGVVEFEDGTCEWFPPTWIKFTDRAH